MNDTPSPFAPFQPSPPTQPEAPAAEKAETKKERAAREKREAKEAQKAVAKAPETPAAPRQKRKQPSENKTALKFDLQTILAAAALLNTDDQAAFEKLVGILSDAGKPGRERLLAAIGKIFE